jgi:hypothetical protein
MVDQALGGCNTVIEPKTRRRYKKHNFVSLEPSFKAALASAFPAAMAKTRHPILFRCTLIAETGQIGVNDSTASSHHCGYAEYPLTGPAKMRTQQYWSHDRRSAPEPRL